MSLKQNILEEFNELTYRIYDTEEVGTWLESKLSLIEQEVMECMPEERNECKTLTEFGREYNIKNGYPEDYSPPDDIAVGFNSCLQQVKDNIKKLFN